MSERDDLRDVLFRLPFARAAATKFVAGETHDVALRTAAELNRAGFRVTLDLLGESVGDRSEAEAAADEYARSLDLIEASEASTTISLKLTQLGLDIDTDFCYANVERIVAHAARLDNFVRIDMEGSAYTQRTLDIFYRAFERHRNVGIVIQSYLKRSAADIDRLVELSAPVRLCKGAYNEPASVAFQDRAEVDASFVRLMKVLLDGGAPTAIATHDERMIEASLAHIEANGIAREAYELQMLYGVRRELQESLTADGWPMRIYLPYGSQWYSYFMRRMAERPANLWFAVRAMLGR
ncbi:MAG TPA: proline dehydrogenase family protein [Gemmatimonadota bacterium]|nr:proline dehydrogenase family protein [Gemmatimonadota bacterium]